MQLTERSTHTQQGLITLTISFSQCISFKCRHLHLLCVAALYAGEARKTKKTADTAKRQQAPLAIITIIITIILTRDSQAPIIQHSAGIRPSALCTFHKRATERVHGTRALPMIISPAWKIIAPRPVYSAGKSEN